MFCAQCGQWMAEGQAACDRCGAARGAAPGGTGGAGPAPGIAHVPGPHTYTPPEAAHSIIDDIRYAGFWRRVGVAFIDALVLFFPTTIVRVAFGGSVWNTRSLGDPEAQRWLLFDMLVTWLYCALLESSVAQGTLGQQACGIRVCDSELRRISFLRATARHFAQWLSILTCGLGYLVNLMTRRRQALHDLIAGCVHVRSESLAARAREEAL